MSKDKRFDLTQDEISYEKHDIRSKAGHLIRDELKLRDDTEADAEELASWMQRRNTFYDRARGRL